MIPLQQAAAEYLQIRRALGHKLEREGWRLPEFIGFLESHGQTHITCEWAMRWALDSSDPSSLGWAGRLAMVRTFAKYLHARDPRTQIPPRPVTPPHQKLIPYVYRDKEVAALMKAAESLQGLGGPTYATLIGLLAATGMRVGEAVRLDRNDVHWNEGILVVRRSKFDKSREVPLHPTTLRALRQYARCRDRFVNNARCQAFFLSNAGTRLFYKNVHLKFLRLLRIARLPNEPQRPRLHDLRHTFAIKTVIDWYKAGDDVQARLYVLSTYLGHVNPTSTYWYLTATSELLQLASLRLESALGRLP
jgi:integrase